MHSETSPLVCKFETEVGTEEESPKEYGKGLALKIGGGVLSVIFISMVAVAVISSRTSSNEVDISDLEEMPLTEANAKCSGDYQSYDKVANAPGAYALLTIINNYRSGKRTASGDKLPALMNSKCDEPAYNAAYWYGADLAGQFDGSPKTVPLSHIDSEGRDFATRVQAFGLDPANSAEALFYGINCIDDAFLVWKDNNNEYEGMQEMMYDERFDKAGVSITYSKAKGSLDAYFVMVYTKDAAAGTPVSVPTAAPVAAAAKTTKVKPTRRPKVKKTKKPRTKRVKKPKNKRKKNKKPKKPKVKRTKKPRNPKPVNA